MPSKKRIPKDWIGRECDCGNPYSDSCPIHGKKKEESGPSGKGHIDNLDDTKHSWE
jgi:hypothetical protein